MSRSRKRTRASHHRRRRKKRGFSFRTFLGVLLILVAIGLFALNPIKDMMIARGTQSNAVANLTREDILSNQQRDVTFDLNEITTIDPLTVLTDGVNPDDLPVIGGIAMPDLQMNLPIHMGTDNAGMYYGAGTISPNQQMGESNYVLASHHSKHPELLFAPLLQAEIGQDIYLTDLEYVYVYDVDNIVEVSPYAVEYMDPTDESIVTLITCSYDLVNRIIVQGSLVEQIPIDEASPEILNAFTIDQTIVE